MTFEQILPILALTPTLVAWLLRRYHGIWVALLPLALSYHGLHEMYASRQSGCGTGYYRGELLYYTGSLSCLGILAVTWRRPEKVADRFGLNPEPAENSSSLGVAPSEKMC